MNTPVDPLLQYPIGKFEWIEHPSRKEIEIAISTLKKFPMILKSTVSGLSKDILLNQYRPDAWNIAQVVHHIADSHMHSYLRIKHALLEENPHIKDYHEVDWAKTEDATNIDLSYSLDLIEALHKRWSLFLKSLSTEEIMKTYFHPKRNKKYTIGTTVLIYAWHCDHHLAHIYNAIRKGY